MISIYYYPTFCYSVSLSTIPRSILENRPKEVFVQAIKSGECGAANPRVEEQTSSVVTDPRVEEQTLSVVTENEKIATNPSIDFREMLNKSCYKSDARMMLYLSDREWVSERNIVETFYTTAEPFTKKNMKGLLVNLNTVYTNLLLTICLQINKSVKVGSSIMSVKAVDKRYNTAERAALNFYIYFQDLKIECSKKNARALEKIAHVCFFHYGIERAIDTISQRSEFFKKFRFSDMDALVNLRAVILRIMAFICNLTAEQFMLCKKALAAISITRAYDNHIHLLPEFLQKINVMNNYPKNLLLKETILLKNATKDNIFNEEQLENMATSLFVEIRARITPEQVLIIFILVLSYDIVFFYRK